MTIHTHVSDLVESRRLVRICWLMASLGIATLQMRLYAQAWHQSGTALESAIVASAWMLGAVLSFQAPDAGRLWGAGFVGGVLVWLFTPAVAWHLAPVREASATFGGMTVCGLILGLFSTAWLTQRRLWSPIGERVLLCKGLVGGTIGLVLAWLLPDTRWSGVVGLLGTIPLLVLDAWPQSRCPLPARRTAGGASPLRLDRGALPLGWWIRYLAARGRLSLTLLASLVTILLGAIWNTIPTPFAGALQAGHQLGKLEWLLGGQLCALAVGLTWLAGPGRGRFGEERRLLPETWRVHARWVWLLSLLVMAGGLLALGLPFLQDPWSLAISLGSYTLAALFWNLLLPRLRPAISTMTLAHRHLYRQPAVPRLLALRQGEEDLALRCVQIAEALLTVIVTPAVGWLTDRFTVDGLLRVVGFGLLVCLAVVVIAFSRAREQQEPEPLARWYGGTGTAAVSGDDRTSLPTGDSNEHTGRTGLAKGKSIL